MGNHTNTFHNIKTVLTWVVQKEQLVELHKANKVSIHKEYHLTVQQTCLRALESSLEER